MSTPLGDFIRTTRDATQPETLGLPDHGRRRSPGLRRVDLAVRAGISVEYLTRIEQGRDSNPSISVINALADALSLNPTARSHLRYLAKITAGECIGHGEPEPATRQIRPALADTLRLMEPGIAVVTNRIGDILDYTSGYELLTSGSGILDTEIPNLTRYVFTDPRARGFFEDWEEIADEQAFDLWWGPSVENAQWLTAELSQAVGPDFTRRLNNHHVPPRGPLIVKHPMGSHLRLRRETLEAATDQQQLTVFLADDAETDSVIAEWSRRKIPRLRAVS